VVSLPREVARDNGDQVSTLGTRPEMDLKENPAFSLVKVFTPAASPSDHPAGTWVIRDEC
jgi:hypothetical protein